MKFLIIFALALTLTLNNASAYDLRHIEFQKLNISTPAADAIDGRITNGQNAADGQFPYQVLITMKRNNYVYSWCGGSLIGQNWVLTAAHCTKGAESVDVYLGSTRRYEAEITYSVPRRDIIVHPRFGSRGLWYDISLIKIPTVTYSARIQPVKLPAMTGSYNSYTGYKAIASGWGRTTSTGSPSNLQWARMEVISNDVCFRTYGYGLASSNICISTYGGVSTCFGDSGGPLVLEDSKLLVGVTSFVRSTDCTRGYPAGLTRVTSYLDWIKYYTGISY